MNPHQPPDPYDLEERKSILEYDANMPREEAERVAVEQMEAKRKKENGEEK